MGNKHPKAESKTKKKGAGKGKKGKTAQKVPKVEMEEEATPYCVVEVIYELKGGSTTQPEELNVDPQTTLASFKEDLKQLKVIQQSVAVRRDNRNDDLGPDHLTLEALQIRNRDVLRFRECP